MWTVEFTGNQLVIKVVVTDDISPPIEMPVPLMSEDCSECTALLLNKGIVFLFTFFYFFPNNIDQP